MPQFLGKCSNGHLFGFNTMPISCPYVVGGKDCQGVLSQVEDPAPRAKKPKPITQPTLVKKKRKVRKKV